MRDERRKPTVSHYGLVISGRDNGDHYVDLFVPELMLKQLDIRPGSKVIVQGLSAADASEFYLRARSGLENSEEGRTPFTALMRFSNVPKVLVHFLTLARENKVRFQAIRTFGYRGKDEAEVVFEGSVPDRQLHFVYRHNVKALLDEILSGLTDDKGNRIEATLINHESLRFHESKVADVASTVYRLEVPVLRDRFLKVRVQMVGDASPFTENELLLARIGLEFDSMTITISTDLKGQNHYLLVFEGRDLEEAPPITNQILEILPATVNVDAISAYEYLAFDPEAVDPRKLKPMGRIEMLCITPEFDELDHESLEDQLQTAISEILGDAKRIKRLTFTPIRDAFDELRKDLAERREAVGDVEKSTVGIFNEALNERYIRLEPLGEGGFGRVYKYLDLQNSSMVAGKHFPGYRVGSKELKALVDRAFGASSDNLIKLHDYFFSDSVPVIITELLPITLANHEKCVYRNPKAVPHQHPRNLREFIHMVTQVCRGLEALHGRERGTGHPDETGYVHGDVKPENIGASVLEGKLTWKLIDFGLAKEYGEDKQRSADMGAGTPPYVSPEASLGDRTPASDVFSLGVTLFEVLCDWRHPTIGYSGQFPQEVTEYRAYLLRARSEKPDGYVPDRFQLGSPFDQAKLPRQAVVELRDIIFRMMAMPVAERTPSAEQARQQLVEWAKRHSSYLT